MVPRKQLSKTAHIDNYALKFMWRFVVGGHVTSLQADGANCVPTAMSQQMLTQCYGSEWTVQELKATRNIVNSVNVEQ